MKATKSLRLRDEDVQQLKIVERTLRLPSESAALQRIFEDGLRQAKADAVIHLYVNEERTIGETAQELEMLVPEIEQILTKRHVKIMDVPADLAERNLQRVADMLDLSNVTEALGKV